MHQSKDAYFNGFFQHNDAPGFWSWQYLLLYQVAESMSNLRDVIMERDKAQNFLVHGRPTEHGGNVSFVVASIVFFCLQ